MEINCQDVGWDFRVSLINELGIYIYIYLYIETEIYLKHIIIWRNSLEGIDKHNIYLYIHRTSIYVYHYSINILHFDFNTTLMSHNLNPQLLSENTHIKIIPIYTQQCTLPRITTPILVQPNPLTFISTYPQQHPHQPKYNTHPPPRDHQNLYPKGPCSITV